MIELIKGSKKLPWSAAHNRLRKHKQMNIIYIILLKKISEVLTLLDSVL